MRDSTTTFLFLGVLAVLIGLAVLGFLGYSYQQRQSFFTQTPEQQALEDTPVDISPEHETALPVAGWQFVQLPTRTSLYAVAFRTAEAAYAVGEHGTVVESNDQGQTWHLAATTLNDTLRDVVFNRETLGIFVGDGPSYEVGEGEEAETVIGGTIATTKSAGASWNLADDEETKRRQFFTAAFRTPAEIFVGGTQGVLLHSTDGGDTWQEVQLGEGQIRDITFFDSSVGLVVGDAVFITEDGAQTWREIPLPEEDAVLHAGVFLDQQTFVLVGDAVYRTADTGVSWEKIDLDVPYPFYDVSFIDDVIGIAVGVQGTVITTADAGVTWQLEHTPVTTDLFDLAVGDDTVIAVGQGGVAIRNIFPAP